MQALSDIVKDGTSAFTVGSGGGGIPEYSSDPASPVAGDTWVLSGGASVIGSPIGMLLTLTTAVSVPTSYQLSYKTASGRIIRTSLT